MYSFSLRNCQLLCQFANILSHSREEQSLIGEEQREETEEPTTQGPGKNQPVY